MDTLHDGVRFAEADRYGGFAVGLIVISAGVRVARETAMQLMDTMPEDDIDTELEVWDQFVTAVRWLARGPRRGISVSRDGGRVSSAGTRRYGADTVSHQLCASGRPARAAGA